AAYKMRRAVQDTTPATARKSRRSVSRTNGLSAAKYTVKPMTTPSTTYSRSWPPLACSSRPAVSGVTDSQYSMSLIQATAPRGRAVPRSARNRSNTAPMAAPAAMVTPKAYSCSARDANGLHPQRQSWARGSARGPDLASVCARRPGRAPGASPGPRGSLEKPAQKPARLFRRPVPRVLQRVHLARQLERSRLQVELLDVELLAPHEQHAGVRFHHDFRVVETFHVEDAFHPQRLPVAQRQRVLSARGRRLLRFGHRRRPPFRPGLSGTASVTYMPGRTRA